MRSDLRELLTPEVQPKRNVSVTSLPLIYKEVRLMMPLKGALTALKYSQISPRRVLCATSGFPKSSFYYYKIRYTDEPPYNLMYLMTYTKDRVLSVQLVCENPQRQIAVVDPVGKGRGFSNYDFVELSSKAVSRLRIYASVEVSPIIAEDTSRRLAGGNRSYLNEPRTGNSANEILTIFWPSVIPGM